MTHGRFLFCNEVGRSRYPARPETGLGQGLCFEVVFYVALGSPWRTPPPRQSCVSPSATRGERERERETVRWEPPRCCLGRACGPGEDVALGDHTTNIHTSPGRDGSRLTGDRQESTHFIRHRGIRAGFTEAEASEGDPAVLSRTPWTAAGRGGGCDSQAPAPHVRCTAFNLPRTQWERERQLMFLCKYLVPRGPALL